LIIEILSHDNEENALVALRIYIDLHRNCCALLEDKVQSFFDFVQVLYEQLPQTVHDVFEVSNGIGLTLAIQSSSFDDGSSNNSTSTKTIIRSKQSFRVLTECPIIIVILFQLHRKYVPINVPKFVELVIKALKIQVQSQVEAQQQFEKQGKIFGGVNPLIKNRAIYSDFIAAQVKTLSFLAYILRSYAPALKAYQDIIPSFIIQLLQNCPPEACSTRKELLVATRHILSTEFRQAFIPYLQKLLEPKILLGTGLTVIEALRPLAYSLLADFIHHARMELPLNLIQLTIKVYSANIYDSTISWSIQTMSAKLLVNLVDCIVTDTVPVDQRRLLLIQILTTFVEKFTSLKQVFQNMQQNSMDVDERTDSDRPIKVTSIQASHDSPDPYRDFKFLLKTLITGLKNILFGLRSCNPPLPQNANNTTSNNLAALTVRGFSPEESELFTQLFRDGVHCFRIYVEDKSRESNERDIKESSNGLPVGLPHTSISMEEKDVLDQFAHVFTVIDPAIFQDVFVSQMTYFIDCVEKNLALLTIPQYFLAISGVSQNFCSILLRFLMDRLEEIGGSNSLKAQIMLRLFKLVFLAVTVYPDENELVLQPHLGELIMGSLRHAKKAHEPLTYFILLRSLFRSIGGGRYELLYKEVLPLLPVLLESLNSLLAAAHQHVTRELFVELCLTVPVRLSVLLPHLGYLMQPLVLALKSNSDLVNQGLRTLELCIDNLTQDFLDPILAPVINDLMSALWRHLQPGSLTPNASTHSQTTLRILGKLGGRNRRMLKEPPKVTYKESTESGLEIIFDENLNLPLDEGVTLAYDTLRYTSSDYEKKSVISPESLPFYQKQAFLFLKATIPMYVDMKLANKKVNRPVYETYLKMFNHRISEKEKEKSAKTDFPVSSSTQRKQAEEETLLLVLKGMFYAASLEIEGAYEFLENLYRHFSFLKVHELLESKEVKLLHYTKILDTVGFAEAIVDAITNENEKLNRVGESMLKVFFETNRILLESSTQATVDKYFFSKMPVFFYFGSRFCSYCYKSEWYYKKGGCRGIKFMSSLDFGITWMLMHEMKFVRALLYILKDDAPLHSIEEGRDTLLQVLRICNTEKEATDAMDVDMPATTTPTIPKTPFVKNGEDRVGYFYQLIVLLVSELSNSNLVVRETIQESLKVLADINKISVTELLLPVRDRLLSPIFGKPLRALPFSLQIGHVDAITYCLSLEPALITFNGELSRLLLEALAIADAEDNALVGKSNQAKNSQLLTNLRVVCLRLLSAAMNCEEFQDPKQQTIRNRIISVFFKALYGKTNEIVQVAKNGLQQVINHRHKLPKDLLQHGLRPILSTLSDYKRLSVHGLEGLARLLELLTSYFKVEIGKKLLEHLQQWADPAMLEDVSSKSLSENQEIRIIVAILNVFHLLPPAANIFMENLVLITIKLETAVRRHIASPFRLPLIDFLHRYIPDALEYFMSKFKIHEPIARLFVNIVEHEKADILRNELLNCGNRVIELLNEEVIAPGDKRPVNKNSNFFAMKLIQNMLRYHPKWLCDSPDLVKCLCDKWEALSGSPLSKNSVVGIKYENILFELLSHYFSYDVTYFIQNKVNIMFLFKLITKENRDTSAVKSFFAETVAKESKDEFKKLILKTFFESYTSNNQIYGLRLIILPILMSNIQLVDDGLVSLINTHIWQNVPTVVDDEDDMLRLEQLQLTTLLVQKTPEALQNYRKEIVKFSWSLLDVDDHSVKQATLIMISTFMDVYEVPEKFLLQILRQLLKVNAQSEVRHMIKQALDIFIPACSKAYEKIQAGGQTSAASSPTKRTRGSSVKKMIVVQEEVPRWISIIQKNLAEESYLSSQLVLIFQFIVNHSSLFYPYRHLFISRMTISLARIGLNLNPSLENKMLTLEMIELIYYWSQNMEKNGNLEDLVEKKRKTTDNDEGPLPMFSIETIINYLIRLACPIGESTSKRETIVKKCCMLIEKFVALAGTEKLNIKLNSIDKLFGSAINEISNEQVNNFCDAFAILNSVITAVSGFSDDKENGNPILGSLDFFFSSQVAKLLEKGIFTDHSKMANAIQEFVKLLFKLSVHYPAMANILQRLNTLSQEYLSNNKFTASVLLYLDQSNENITAFVPSLCKLLIHYTRESLGRNTNANQASTAQANSNAKPGSTNLSSTLPQVSTPSISTANQSSSENSGTASALAKDINKIIILICQLLLKCVNSLEEHRKILIQAFSLLIDKAGDYDLCAFLLEQCKSWIYSKSDTFPSMKEKTNLLVKFLSFETKQPDLFKEFLQVVLYIYQENNFARTDLTVKLEPAFLIGLRFHKQDPELQREFFNLFENSIQMSHYSRLNYVFAIQNWAHFGQYYWIKLVSDLLVGTIIGQSKENKVELPVGFLKTFNMSLIAGGPVEGSLSKGSALEGLFKSHCSFLNENANATMSSLLNPIRLLMYIDSTKCSVFFEKLFCMIWKRLGKSEKEELTNALVAFLSKEYHQNQRYNRPNCVSTLLDAIGKSEELIVLPPALVKYIGKTFNSWHAGIHLLLRYQNSSDSLNTNQKFLNQTMDALSELYELINENDMWYGLWRRRCIFPETNCALSFEQNGMYSQAQNMYENAQNKARQGNIPFQEAEYCLWESRWKKCSMKLQQWDLLSELSKHDTNKNLQLLCSWRQSDLQKKDIDNMHGLLNVLNSNVNPQNDFQSTIQRKLYKAYLCLHEHYLLAQTKDDTRISYYQKLYEETVQLALHYWYSLPPVTSHSHIPLLVIFQQIVELNEAHQIFINLQSVALNVRQQVTQELKGILSTWRDRLPNLWDDINIWSDLVNWRRHVFSAINKTFEPFAMESSGPNQNQNNAQNNTMSFSYRGYHETAWIINRFAHVARKHQLIDVCIHSLSEIYSLPNIEIQDAFLKLREQAKCYFQNTKELSTGLEIINKTNLGYFSNQQKAEFITLKAIFLSKMNLVEEANKIFTQAVQVDMNLAKGWAAWGQFNDQRFQATKDMTFGTNAVNCYLQASTLHRNARARKYLARVLWLLSFEDNQGTLSKAFELFNSELPTWYWIAFIPQLLTSLTRKEAKQARNLLTKIVKTFPQAIYFPLRTTHEDFRQHLGKRRLEEVKEKSENEDKGKDTVESPAPGDTHAPVVSETPTPIETPVGEGTASAEATTPSTPTLGNTKRHPWEHSEDLLSILKTGYPLLGLSMENMVDHIIQRLRSSPDEDLYRIIVTLLYESFQVKTKRRSYLAIDGKIERKRDRNNSISKLNGTKSSKGVRHAFFAEPF
jgi:transformation/transcription domain-associated protein